MSNQDSLLYKHSSFTGLVGVAQEDITPPVGIYCRNWAAAKSDTAVGIHQPLMLTCQTFQSCREEKPLVLISADLGWWKNMEDEHFLRHEILLALSLDSSRLMFCLSHTHAGPSLSRDDASKPGGEFIESYLLQIRDRAITAAKHAVKSAVPATTTWVYGKCNLASNRDLPDADANRIVVGFNPKNDADDTLLVGRTTNSENQVISTIVNYACHPTTLAWDNLLISPDYIGSMRGIVETATSAPCLFLQGASGELAPAEQYTGDVSIAEKHGRQLGYAVLAALESMLPPNDALSLEQVIESGAPLAVWRRTQKQSLVNISANMIEIQLPLKNLPALENIEAEWRTCEDRTLKERLWRKLNVRKAVGNGDSANIPLWIWKLGDAFLIGQPNEAYSLYQSEIRKQLPGYAVAVMNVVNGHIGYLPPVDLYRNDIYSVWQTPFAAGALEILLQKSLEVANQMISKE